MDFVAFDIEGDATYDGFKSCAVWSDMEQSIYYTRREAIMSLREHAYREYTLVAHNAEYDISCLFWPILENVTIKYFNERFNRGEWRYDPVRKPAEIWDSLSLAGGLPLWKVGKAIGCEKYNTPQQLTSNDVSQYKWQCEAHQEWECLRCYNLRDAEIVWRYMQQYSEFLQTYGVKPRRTIASAASALWRQLDNPDTCRIENRKLEQFIRRSYFGGRVDAFKIGTVPNIYVGDINSMYPYAMSANPMPNPRRLSYNDDPNISPRIIRRDGISKATVTVPYIHVPVLPYNWHGKLVFGYGTFTGTWNHAELQVAVERGATINEIHESVISRERIYPFSNFVGVLTELRKRYKEQGNSLELVVKILLNSLYGRIGLNECQSVETLTPMAPRTGSKDYPGNTIFPMGDHLFVRERKEQKWRQDYANVMWASAITSGARLCLYDYLEYYSESLVYCDTDSVFTVSPIAGTSMELGELKDEGYYDRGYIIGPKLYRLESSTGDAKVRAKGVPSSKAMEYLQTGKAEYSVPYRPRESVSRGQLAGEWHSVTKRMRTTPTKRQPNDPIAATSEGSYSDTEPLFISPG